MHPVAAAAKRRHKKSINLQGVATMARNAVAGVDWSAAVTVEQSSRPGTGQVVIKSEAAQYMVEVDPSRGPFVGWMSAKVLPEGGDSYEYLASANTSSAGWGDVWEAITEYEDLLRQEQQFSRGWDSGEDAHGSRLLSGGFDGGVVI